MRVPVQLQLVPEHGVLGGEIAAVGEVDAERDVITRGDVDAVDVRSVARRRGVVDVAHALHQVERRR